MDAHLQLRFDCPPFPDPPRLSVMGHDGRSYRLIAQVELHEPISNAGLASIAKGVTNRWFEPVLSSKPEEELSDWIESLGKRLL